MRKPIHAFSALITILALSIVVDAGAQIPSNQDVVEKATNAYYSLKKKEFKGFTATIDPNWEVILGHTATPKNLKLFRAVQFSLVVDANGAASIQRKVSADADKPELQKVVEQIHADLQRLVAGFFNTWRMFVVGSPFLEANNQIKIENLGKQYSFLSTTQAGELMIMMTSDFLITEWNLSGPRAKRTVKPHFQKTVEGFLLTGYQGIFEPVGEGIKTTLDFEIEYQEVNGLKLPSKVQLKGTHGTEPVEAELAFRVSSE